MSRRDEETLLIVEADPTLRRTLATFLKHDYRVLGVKSGMEAWATLAGEKIDLILFDDGVPDVNGVDFYHEARVRYPDVIRVLVTESRDYPDVMKIIQEAAVFDRRDENAGATPTGMSMRWPDAIACWGEALCVADAGNNRVMIWNDVPSESGAGCQWIIGQGDPSQVDHNAGQYWPHAGTLNMPYGLGAAGDWLCVADTANSRLLGWYKQDIVTGAPARALAGQLRFDLKGDNQWMFPSPNTLCSPYGLSIDEGLLAIADSGNNRVVIRPLHREVSG